MSTFIAFIAAIGAGTIIAALVGHWTAIWSHRQAWINALRDDIAEFFKSVEKMNYVIKDYLQDSAATEEKRRDARIAVLFVYGRIRLRLNRTEDRHIELETKLGQFVNEPLSQVLADGNRIDETIDLARRILKDEWEATKYPWKPYYEKVIGRGLRRSRATSR